jgi:hypothetical protein
LYFCTSKASKLRHTELRFAAQSAVCAGLFSSYAELLTKPLSFELNLYRLGS